KYVTFQGPRTWIEAFFRKDIANTYVSQDQTSFRRGKYTRVGDLASEKPIIHYRVVWGHSRRQETSGDPSGDPCRFNEKVSFRLRMSGLRWYQLARNTLYEQNSTPWRSWTFCHEL
ncbi:unnamed protein product, partial [Ectocarpus fasciculatus]